MIHLSSPLMGSYTVGKALPCSCPVSAEILLFLLLMHRYKAALVMSAWFDMSKGFLHKFQEFGSSDLEQNYPIVKEGNKIKSLKQSFELIFLAFCSPLKKGSHLRSFVLYRNSYNAKKQSMFI